MRVTGKHKSNMNSGPSRPTASPCHTVPLRTAGRCRLHVPVITQHMQPTPSRLQVSFRFSKTTHGRAHITNADGHTVLNTCEKQGAVASRGTLKMSPRFPRSSCRYAVMRVAGLAPSLRVRLPVFRGDHHQGHPPGCICPLRSLSRCIILLTTRQGDAPHLCLEQARSRRNPLSLRGSNRARIFGPPVYSFLTCLASPLTPATPQSGHDHPDFSSGSTCSLMRCINYGKYMGGSERHTHPPIYAHNLGWFLFAGHLIGRPPTPTTDMNRPRSPATSDMAYIQCRNARCASNGNRIRSVPMFEIPRYAQAKPAVRTSLRLLLFPVEVWGGGFIPPVGRQTDRTNRKGDESIQNLIVPLPPTSPGLRPRSRAPILACPHEQSRWVRAYDSCKERPERAGTHSKHVRTQRSSGRGIRQTIPTRSGNIGLHGLSLSSDHAGAGTFGGGGALPRAQRRGSGKFGGRRDLVLWYIPGRMRTRTEVTRAERAHVRLGVWRSAAGSWFKGAAGGEAVCSSGLSQWSGPSETKPCQFSRHGRAGCMCACFETSRTKNTARA